ncbi:regulator of length of O-antigen component of lipopolysaccharide chains [hydrothermal vent metagenome]|uniref:Regulator of length of O-antigen component of lipopolysaccharide chains n=1 Tax=hydrothermal vent metagenome TaxID=652676 RepID=A0A3B0WXC5_9ZZZZ
MDQSNTAQMPQNDEIDLFELWEGLVQEKLTILISLLTVLAVALVYVFSVTPVYKASTYLLPPKLDGVIPMNVLAEVVSNTVNSTESVFALFQTNLKSRQSLTVIFNQYDLAKMYEPNIDALVEAEKMKVQNKALTQFFQDFSVQILDKEVLSAGMSVQLSLALSDVQVAEILNAIVQQAEQQTVNHIARQLKSEKRAQEQFVQQKISSARQVEQSRRLDRIAQLDEAIQITKGLNLNNPMPSGPTLNVNNLNETGGYEGVALYLLGSDLLEAAKKVLEQRKNDDAFIAKLRGWQESLQLLKSFKIEPEKFGVVQVDQAALFAEKIKPNKGLVLAVAGVLGLMLGVFIALIRRAIKKRKEESALNPV